LQFFKDCVYGGGMPVHLYNIIFKVNPFLMLLKI
jgi:hypothetical protein